MEASQGQLGAEGDCRMLSLLLPSPQSEAVTHEMEELTLQPTQSLPPLNERKNGEEVPSFNIFLCIFCLNTHCTMLHIGHCNYLLDAA